MNYLLKEALLINEDRAFVADVLVKGDRIEKIASSIEAPDYAHEEINLSGKYLMPGIIDDQVHFREPGLTHKAEIATEARAAVAGGTTSFMEMPNTVPQAVTIDLLEEKYAIGADRSPANYSFFFGATNDNLKEVLKVDKQRVCGVKVFMGSSTGNMLVDNEKTLRGIFAECDHLIATHCEVEGVVQENLAIYREKYGDDIPFECHPEIRSVEACYQSSQMAMDLAREYDTRLHVLHISTQEEAESFSNEIPLLEKKITAEACVHHLWFDADEYTRLGSKIKCNPAIKEKRHKEAILKALLDDRIDIIATDHAPHTLEEKAGNYVSAPAGLPLVQHSLLMMLDFVKEGKFSLEKLVEKMCHAPAQCFRLRERGFLREGYKADLVVVDPNRKTLVGPENIAFKCGWSPLSGHRFSHYVEKTFVSGHLAYDNGKFDLSLTGQRLEFN